MKPAPFAFAQPETVEEVCHLLDQEGEGARLLAGGLSLGAMLNFRLVTPALLVDLNCVRGLDGTGLEADVVTTGALVRQAAALADPALAEAVPLLAAALPHVGHYQTRSRGTLAGSVAHADPSAEIPLALAVLDGVVELRSRRRSRMVKARDFFVSALATARQPNELIAALHWPRARPGSLHAFREIAMREGDYALVAVAGTARLGAGGGVTDLVLGYAGCGDTPQILSPPGLGEARLDEPVIDDLATLAADTVRCRGDIHSSAAHRRQLVRTLTRDVLEDLRAEAGERAHA